jgi:hypothetical protein
MTLRPHVGQIKNPTRAPPVVLPRAHPAIAEEGRDKRVDRPDIPPGKGRPKPQSPATKFAPNTATGPLQGDQGIVFSTYTPFGGIANGPLIPPDPSGADSPPGIVLSVGNTYIMVSTDNGASFKEHDSSAFLPSAIGRPVDQVMIYVPHRQLFAWMMQHGADPTTKDGTFRLAVATVQALIKDFEHAWTPYDFTSSDLGVPGVGTDRQDLAFSETRLYMTTNLVGKGRVVLSVSLEDLVKGAGISWFHIGPLGGEFQYSDLSQQNSQDVHSVAIASGSSLRVMKLTDSTGTAALHNVDVGLFAIAANLVSLDPNKTDWLTTGVANVSASVVNGNDLWVAWDAAASAAGDKPFYPHPHVRLARIDRTTWKTVEERQVWNPDFAFAYGCLAVGPTGDVGYGVGVGGPKDFPNSCFGILGDFIVYFRDTSTATGKGVPPGSTVLEARWGDYITVRRSTVDSRRFAAFGYFTVKNDPNGDQRPYYLSYGRP